MEGFPQNNQKIEEEIQNENRIEKPQVKEGVDFVFEQHPELSEIGTKEQYSEYLNSVFPESKVQDILYHGTKNNFDEFNKEFLGQNTGSPSAFNGFFFASSIDTSLSYIGEQKTEYAKEYIDYVQQYQVLMEENKQKMQEVSKEMDVLWNRRKSLLKKLADTVNGIDSKKLYEEKLAELDSLREEEKSLWEKNYMLDKTLGAYAKTVSKPVEDFYDTYIQPEEGSKVMAVILNMKNPGIHDDKNQGYRIETYNNRTLDDKAEGKDGTIIHNTKDFSIFVYKPALFGGKEIKEDTDVYVVYEPDQIHILGSDSDMQKFQDFIEKK
ncbi:MAG: hypothetical protein LRY44_00215 [Candidatus Pacebacteria bacterium]|nr:hypothetical protein [Candidatus Paceibacterota bacterium]